MSQELVVQALGYASIGQFIAALLYLSQSKRFPTPLKDYLADKPHGRQAQEVDNKKELSTDMEKATEDRRQLYLRSSVAGMGLVTLYLVYVYGKSANENIKVPAAAVIASMLIAGNIFSGPKC